MDIARISPWELIGYGGQAVFATRFVWQWFQSEKKGRSFIPVGFWWLSLLGGATLAAYAIHIRAWPIAIGQVSALLIYARNLWMIHFPRAALTGAKNISN
jgi:lipid-A-disaccharide synthase-like uncharacterized protein